MVEVKIDDNQFLHIRLVDRVIFKTDGDKIVFLDISDEGIQFTLNDPKIFYNIKMDKILFYAIGENKRNILNEEIEKAENGLLGEVNG